MGGSRMCGVVKTLLSFAFYTYEWGGGGRRLVSELAGSP